MASGNREDQTNQMNLSDIDINWLLRRIVSQQNQYSQQNTERVSAIEESSDHEDPAEPIPAVSLEKGGISEALNTCRSDVVREFDAEVFIEEIRQLPCIWNTSLAAYKDRGIKANAWNKLSTMFNKDVNFLKTQFKYLKDNLKKCIDRQAKAMKSGSASSKVPKCKFYHELSFLYDTTANKPTQSNVTIGKGIKETTDDMQSSCSTDSEDVVTLSGKKRLIQETVEDNSINNKSRKSAKTRAEMGYTVDTMLVKALQDLDKPDSPLDEQNAMDADILFCKSIIPTLKELPARKNRQAKLKIQQVLYDIEFEDTV